MAMAFKSGFQAKGVNAFPGVEDWDGYMLRIFWADTNAAFGTREMDWRFSIEQPGRTCICGMRF